MLSSGKLLLQSVGCCAVGCKSLH